MVIFRFVFKYGAKTETFERVWHWEKQNAHRIFAKHVVPVPPHPFHAKTETVGWQWKVLTEKNQLKKADMKKQRKDFHDQDHTKNKHQNIFSVPKVNQYYCFNANALFFSF